ncbi:hypothetical protein [Sporomusa sphaeroides]|uniref:hypothetical protein n=1 Tax=Sporomusa sphaeroides TaxID=47679 RepID=UPI002CFD28CA|nr:hypothetical protein [Sporomusa sphaeroides]HML32132.1 hypothetical protein [Sporomusa sphaeroides]
MNGQVFPLFENAHVLRTAMLTALRDYAFEYGRLVHEDYSDGIVSGCALTTTVDTITINRGVIRYGGNLYLITAPLSLPYYSTDNWIVFKLEFKDEAKKDGYIYREVEIALSDNLELTNKEMELCRFKLQAGARLRMKYVDLADRNTEFDTLNTIYAPFAAYGVSSLSPDITRTFAREAIAYAMDPVDTVFCLQALNARGAMSRETILFYIASRLKAAYTDCDNLAMFEALLTILNQIKDNGEREVARRQRQRRQVIVD